MSGALCCQDGLGFEVAGAVVGPLALGPAPPGALVLILFCLLRQRLGAARGEAAGLSFSPLSQRLVRRRAPQVLAQGCVSAEVG